MEFDLAQAVSEYGFPIIAAMGMGYFIYFIWKWVTETIDPVLGETMGTLIKLVDRVRMLDNDMIRLNSKLSMVLEHRALLDEKLSKEERQELNHIVAKYQSVSQAFNSAGDITDDPEPVKEPEAEETKPQTSFSKDDLKNIKDKLIKK